MDELIAIIVQRTGISEEQAAEIVDIVLGFIKEKLPAPIANQLDRLISGEEEGVLGTITGALGDLFGKKE